MQPFSVRGVLHLGKREFETKIKTLSVNGRLMPAKVAALSDLEKASFVAFIVRARGPVLIEFMSSAINEEWLNASGYLYTTKGLKTGYTFRHTSEHTIR